MTALGNTQGKRYTIPLATTISLLTYPLTHFTSYPILSAWASDRGHLKNVYLMIRHSANLEIQCKDDNTPLLFAAATNRPDMIRLLLKHGANIHAVDHEGNNPLDPLVGR